MKQDSFSDTLYGKSLSLLTDLYEITMSYSYWKQKMAEREASFYFSFRKKPFGGSYAVFAGLETFIKYLRDFSFDKSDLDYLKTIVDPQGNPIFSAEFLEYLQNLRFTCDIDAICEGSVCFPNEPLVRVTGPILQAQLIESSLLNIINFQTLIATKSARVCQVAHPDPVVEFGLRRAQGIDGAISASRAAYIGGCVSTSNTIAGKMFDIPVAGTHAHSWIMAFDDEYQAFYAFSEAMPSSCVFLIDTYDSIQGAKNAIKAAKELRKKGHEMIGVRLDSGDMAKLSCQIRIMLDKEGFSNAKIMASNDLDEFLIRDLKNKGAKIDVWGVGTNLVTGKNQPALDGVYKLCAMQNTKGEWEYKMKISEQMSKTTNPGILQVKRFEKDGRYIFDGIYDTLQKAELTTFLDSSNNENFKNASDTSKDLLIPIMRKGRIVCDFPKLKDIRDFAEKELMKLYPENKEIFNSEPYFVGLEKNLFEMKQKLIQKNKPSKT